MAAIKARIALFWHCLTHLHQGITMKANGVTYLIGCGCGLKFYERKLVFRNGKLER